MNKILLISGACGQLGQSITQRFQEKGWRTIGIDINETNIEPKAVDALYIQGSVTDKKTWEKAFYCISTILNEEKAEICLINCAGVAVFSDSRFRTLEEFRYVMEINLYGPILGITSLVEFIEEKNKVKTQAITARVINIGSIYGSLAPDNRIYTDSERVSSEVYGASKAGVIQITKYFAVKYAKSGVIVNCISPGGVINTMHQNDKFIEAYSGRVPMGRMCTGNEIAAMAYNICRMPDYCTGQNYVIDGGLDSW